MQTVDPLQWRPILGYEDLYEISRDGSIRRVQGYHGAKAGNPTRGFVSTHASTKAKRYRAVTLYRSNVGRKFYIHRLVYEAFMGRIPDGMDINHRDGDRFNNNLENLEVLTRKENLAHAVRSGLMSNQAGVGNHGAKLDDNTVRSIRILHQRGKWGYQKLSKMLGVSWGTVRDILKGTAWSHVTDIHIPNCEALEELRETLWAKNRPKRKKPNREIRSEAYMRWIRRLPCIGCGKAAPSEASHTGDHGLSIKSSDFTCIPLCADCHRTGRYAYHKIGRAAFEIHHSSDINELVAFLNNMWRTKQFDALALQEWFRGMWGRKNERRAA